MKLYNEDWRTSMTIRPTEAGVATFRGFMGGYRLKIKTNGVEVQDLEIYLDRDTVINCDYDDQLNKFTC